MAHQIPLADVPIEPLDASSISQDLHPPKREQRIRLTDLPFELLESIFINLRTSSILSLALTCHALHPAALSCLHSTITIAPCTAIPTNLPQPRHFSPDPYALATRLLADPSLGPRIRHFTFSPSSALTLNPRRTLPSHVHTSDHSWGLRSRKQPPNLHRLTRHIAQAARAGLLSTADHDAWTHGLRSGAAQHAVAACLAASPRLRRLDLVWAGTGPPFAGPSWLREALPLLEDFSLRVPGKEGRRGRRRGWGAGEEWRVPEWAGRGAVAAGHGRLRAVRFVGPRGWELGAVADAGWDGVVAMRPGEVRGVAEGLPRDRPGEVPWRAWAEVGRAVRGLDVGGRGVKAASTVVRVLEVREAGVGPGELGEVLVLAGRNCKGLERVVVELVHPVSDGNGAKTVVRLDEVGGALRRLLPRAPGHQGEMMEYSVGALVGLPVVNRSLRSLCLTLDFFTPKKDIARAGGGEAGVRNMSWGVSGRLGSLRGFEKLEVLEVSWVVLVGWSLRSLRREGRKNWTGMLDGGYLREVLPTGLSWLTVSDEMAAWKRWKWRPKDVTELVREWFGEGRAVGLKGLVLKLRHVSESGGKWEWSEGVREEMRHVCEKAGVLCQFEIH